MKKLFLALVFIGVAALCAQAQNLFVGGTMGFDIDASSSKYGSDKDKGPSTTSFELSPKVGYYLNDKVAAGVELTLGFSSYNPRTEYGSKSNTFQFGLAPFLRYTLLSVGNFAVLAEGGLGIYGRTQKDGPSTFGIGLEAKPLLTYNLSKTISLEVSSGFARFGFFTESTKNGEYKSSETSFGFGVDSNDFFRSPYQIGLIYKFQINKK